MDASIIIALGSAIATLMTAVGAWYGMRQTAKRDEITRLNDEIRKLLERCDGLESKIGELQKQVERLIRYKVILLEYIVKLRLLLTERGVTIEAIPEDQ